MNWKNCSLFAFSMMAAVAHADINMTTVLFEYGNEVSRGLTVVGTDNASIIQGTDHTVKATLVEQNDEGGEVLFEITKDNEIIASPVVRMSWEQEAVITVGHNDELANIVPAMKLVCIAMPLIEVEITEVVHEVEQA